MKILILLNVMMFCYRDFWTCMKIWTQRKSFELTERVPASICQFRASTLPSELQIQLAHLAIFSMRLLLIHCLFLTAFGRGVQSKVRRGPSSRWRIYKISFLPHSCKKSTLHTTVVAHDFLRQKSLVIRKRYAMLGRI